MRITKTRQVWVFICIFVSAATIGRADTITTGMFRQWGNEISDTIEEDMGRSDGLYNTNASDGWPGYAWDQGIMLTANTAAAKVDSSRLSRVQQHAQAIYDQFRCYTNSYWAYNSGANSCGDRYYDDNAWIALGFLELYELTLNTTYLDWAEEILLFCMSGENGASDSPDGGIRWHEPDTGGASVCATAPTILANLMVYQLTGVESYKTDALRLYNWISTSDLRINSGIYHETAQGPRAYQTAVMLQCALRLYQITSDAAYLTEAQHLGLTMQDYFMNPTTCALNEFGYWGGHDMTNAYVDLYNVDGDTNWLKIAAGYLEYLYVDCIDPVSSTFPDEWNDASGSSITQSLLCNASVTRAFWKMADTPGTTTNRHEFEKELKLRLMLDETTGTTAADTSGFGQNSTLGGTSFTFDASATTGQFNGALTFDGTDDYIDVPDGFDNFRAGITVSVWAYPTETKSWSRFMDFGNGEYDNNILLARYGSSNDLIFEAYDGTSSGGQVIASGAIQLNQWQMFTATLDAGGNVILYKNGSQIATGTTALPSNIQRINNYIGRSNWDADSYFKGKMDDVRIYNYPLTTQQVANLYQYAGQAVNPSIPDGSKGVIDVVNLEWISGSLGAEHDIYIGTEQAAVAAATTASEEYKGRVGTLSYTPELSENTDYYWRIDEITANANIVTGDVWSFTTWQLPTQELFAHYTMDTDFISGQTLINTAANRPLYNANILGPATGAAGKVGQALSFDGSNDYVDVPDGMDDLTDGMTVSFWAYPTAANNWARFIDFGNGAGSNNIVFARQETSNTLSFEAYNGTSTGGQITASDAIELNQWQMFTAVLRPSGYAVLFKNGIKIASGQTAVPPIVTRANNYIGKSNWSADPYYKGRIDDLAIWNRPLTRDEVAGIYNRSLTGHSFADNPDPEAPIAHWQFNDSGDMIADDTSGNGYDGTLINMDTAAWTLGKQCTALSFDGTDDYIQIPRYQGVTSTSARTICAWIKTDTTGALMSWGSSTPVGGDYWYMLVNYASSGTPGALHVSVHGGNTVGTTDLRDGQWHHIAVVMDNDGSPDASELLMYVDGQPETLSYVTAQAINTAADSDVYIGNRFGGTSNLFTGLIDEVKIYDRAVSPEMINQMYTKHALISDFEPDGTVDLNDFAAFSSFWGNSATCDGDLTCDCVVDMDDLMFFIEEWLNHI